MKTFLALFVAALMFMAYGCVGTGAKRNTDPAERLRPHKFLVDNNTIQFVGSIDKASSQAELERLAAVSDDQPVNVYFQVNYADMDELQQVIAVLKTKDATCYARQVGGPGFTAFQACKVRLVGEQTLLQARRITATFPNVNLDQAKEMVAKFETYEKTVTGVEADAMGMSLSSYVQLLGKDGLNLNGSSQIFDANAADALGVLSCANQTDTMTRRYVVQQLQQGTAMLDIKMSVCPDPRVVLEPAAPAEAFSYFGIIVDQSAKNLEPSRDL